MNTTDKLAEALRLAREWFRHEEAGEGPQADAVIKAADEALAADDAEQAAKAVPAGFKLVPVEPTPKMIERGRWDEFGEDCTRAYPVPDYYVTDVWAAMLEAAPTPPAPEAQQPAGQGQDERAAFEAWAATYSTFPLERDDYPRLGTTSYTQMEQTMLWDAWQARAALAQRREPLTDEQISAAIDARLSLHMQNGIEEPFSLMVDRAIERAHGIGATTGKEPGNV